MTEQYSRRDFLKKSVQVGVGIVTGVCLSSLVTGCGENPPQDHVSYHELFNGAVKVTRTETTQGGGLFSKYGGSDWVRAVKLEFEITKSGNYLFEGWVANYRAQDSLGEKWEYPVDEVPYKEGRDLHSLIYRLEATRVGKDNNIERDTEEFRHHGIASSFNIQGKPMAR